MGCSSDKSDRSPSESEENNVLEVPDPVGPVRLCLSVGETVSGKKDRRHTQLRVTLRDGRIVAAEEEANVEYSEIEWSVADILVSPS